MSAVGEAEEGAMSVAGEAKDRSVGELAAALGGVLEARGWKVATAESCTGGLIAGAITDVPGSSGWFERGFVTYSNEAKVEMLGVASDALAAHGAVSEAVAAEMASGALARSTADLAVAVTGVAGPSGGTPAKPVGMVCFGWAKRSGAVETATRHFDGDRAAVREATVAAALAGLIHRARSD
jgi:nicotinamide-nucleotide amidase